MPGKFGGQSVFILVDGYNLASSKVKGLRYKHEAIQEASHGVGDSYEETTAVGVSKVELAQDGAFFDTDLNRIHTAMNSSPPTNPQATVRIVCIGFSGQTAGERFIGFQGDYIEAYEVLGQRGALTK